MAFTDFATVLRSSRFRRLFAVRATGQLSDGLFQAALATFVLFSPERQASPQAIVTAFAILYLPYSFIGPFAGVFLDTWSRRQVLLYGNLIRAVIVVGICYLTAAGHSGMDLGIAVLVALGINRFILAGLSAALPHTVSRSTLVTANAFAPTAGTMCAAIGGLAGVVLRGAFGGGDRGSTVVLIIATAGFALSGLLALRMSKGLLGPDGETPRDTVMGVIRGLGDGAVTLWHQRPALRAIT
ncbi:MAG: MFS transporter, partial [Actinomycetes bacterium]